MLPTEPLIHRRGIVSFASPVALSDVVGIDIRCAFGVVCGSPQYHIFVVYPRTNCPPLHRQPRSAPASMHFGSFAMIAWRIDVPFPYARCIVYPVWISSILGSFVRLFAVIVSGVLEAIKWQAFSASPRGEIAKRTTSRIGFARTVATTKIMIWLSDTTAPSWDWPVHRMPTVSRLVYREARGTVRGLTAIALENEGFPAEGVVRSGSGSPNPLSRRIPLVFWCQHTTQ